MKRYDVELARRLYAPPASALLTEMTKIGEGLAAHFTELQRDPTASKCEQLATNLYGAGRMLMRLRERLMAEGEMAGASD